MGAPPITPAAAASAPAHRTDNQDPALFGQTPSQTVGPFFHYGLPWKGGADLVAASGLGARLDLFPEEHDRLHRAPPRAPATGEVIEIVGTVRDGAGAPVPDAMIEIWQANAAGRYIHMGDQHDAPVDPNFSGAGRAVTDADGRYRFTSIKPGAYPWRNHHNAWRPAHIHFSLFGSSFLSRLVTQMYFPGDPLFAYDPIFQSIPDPAARDRLVSRFDIGSTEAEWALGYTFDIVLRGRGATPFEEPHDD